MRIGRVINGYSNYLAILVADAAVANAYPGSDDEELYAAACDATDDSLAVGKGKGLVVEIGGCGVAEVHRFGDTIVIPEHYTGDEDAAAEAALDAAIATHPTTKPKKIGTVDVPSGVLVLGCIVHRGPVDLPKLPVGKATKTQAGVAIGVPPGKYAVWREELELRGPYGSIGTRTRIVPARSKVVAKAPIAKIAAPTPVPKQTAGIARRLVDGWAAIKSLAIAPDGRLFAGENGGFRVAGFDGDAAWNRRLAKPPKKQIVLFAETWVELVGNDLLVMLRGHNEAAALHVLDSATGDVKKTLKIPPASGFKVAGDRLVLMTDETTVLSYPKLKRLASFSEYTSKLQVAVSPDGKWLATIGDGCHVYDWKKLAFVRTIEIDPDPYGVGFADGELVVGDYKGCIGLYDPRTGKRRARIDVARERSRKPTVIAIATSKRHIAAARDDGAVSVVDRATNKVVHVFDGHAAAKLSIGANALDGIAFSPDGSTLWVTGAPKGKPAGLTGYRLDR